MVWVRPIRVVCDSVEKLRRTINATLCVVILAAGVVGGLYLASSRPHPPERARIARVPEVTLVAVEPCTFEAPVVGHGTVQPRRQVKIVPEVGGRLIQVHPDLAVGKVIPKDELLFQIDPRSYRLQVEQAQAEVKRLEAQLVRLRDEKGTLQARLKVAKELLALAERNWQREKELEAGVSTTEVELVVAETAYLRQEDQVLQYESQLAVNPHQIAEIEALLENQRAQLAEAERRVEQTQIHCPFDARVESISASSSQVVIAGFAIAVLTDMEALELVAGVDPRELRWANVRAFARAVGKDLGTAPDATIAWTLRDCEYRWTGPVTRLERVDEATRTARVVVEIRDVMKGMTLASGDSRPPLSVGMFCRVEIPAEPLPNALTVPRSAIHDDGSGSEARYVYVFEPIGPDSQEGRLVMRRVPMLRTVGDCVLVNFERSPSLAAEWAGTGPGEVCELHSGDEVIISPLPGAVEGMRLRCPARTRVADLDRRPFPDPWPGADPWDTHRPPPLLAVTARAGGDS
jgi:multidrug efflux system membrane fusion protein